jgi:ribosomal protein S8
MFRDQLRDAIKKFENNERYNESITEKPLTNLVQGLETQESNSNLNYTRMDTAIAYLKGLVSKDSLSPILLNDMIESLKTGDAVIVSTSKGDIELLEKIKELHLASPYETSVESTIFKMQNLATEYMTLKRNWFFQDKKLNEFKNTLGKIMMDYEKESRDEKMKKKNSN